MNQVVITGMGWITPLGHDIESVWKKLLAGESGVSRIALFDADTFPTQIAAQVKDFDFHQHVPRPERFEGCGRGSGFALAACVQAWTQARLDGAEIDLDRVGIYLGAGEGSLDFNAFTRSTLNSFVKSDGKIDTVAWARAARELMDVVREHEQEPNMPVSHIARLTGARGPTFNCLTACAASTQAIGEATEILRRGDADIMIAGGAHSMIHPFGVTGFNRLTALSEGNADPAAASKPFDAERGGFVLGEGAGIVILESLEHAKKRGVTPLAEIVGYGSTADAFRITDQHETGLGAVLAMRQALEDAQLTPADIGYINAHGTGTRENDGNETTAIKHVFVGAGDDATVPPVSSIKSMMGHLIAAAGAVELITCVLAIRDGQLPPTINLHKRDPECDLDYIPNVSRAKAVDVVMSNSFGFGGQNDTAIVRRFTR